MMLCASRFHFKEAAGYKSPNPTTWSERLPDSEAPPGPVSVADTEVVLSPYKAVIPMAACPPNTGVANTYVGVNMPKSVGDFTPT
jgi:hypothetical protein